jgi:hypothetical protein
VDESPPLVAVAGRWKEFTDRRLIGMKNLLREDNVGVLQDFVIGIDLPRTRLCQFSAQNDPSVRHHFVHTEAIEIHTCHSLPCAISLCAQSWQQIFGGGVPSESCALTRLSDSWVF